MNLTELFSNVQSRYLFFTGKGGVGKTTLACSVAVYLAESGKKVLLVSTDPASNLSDVLQSTVGEEVTAHVELANLFTVNINPEDAATDYRERVIAPLSGQSTQEEIQKVRENLSGACTTEIASFDEFSRFITGEGASHEYDVIVFDTAPTGHTLRLLELPAAWDEFLDANPQGASCIGPSSALKSSKDRYRQVMNSLRDPALTCYYLVSRPDKIALREAARTSEELNELGLGHQVLLLNGVFRASGTDDQVASKFEQLSQNYLKGMPESLKALTSFEFPLLPYNVLGLERLRSIYDQTLQRKLIQAELNLIPAIQADFELKKVQELVNALSDGKTTGLIMAMGKGGVGKTLVASTIAVLLAQKGHKVLLTTTDPAAHIQEFISQLDLLPETLTIERIDPKVETSLYVDKIMQQKGATLDAEGKKLLFEDLQSPCTEEVAVFHAFSRAVHLGKRQFVVMDTAPTGHTLLLLDTAGSYHREVLRNTSLNPDRITTPYMSLQDPDFAKIVLVALPETTPIREAEALQNDLIRAGIQPFAWVMNQCLSLVQGLKDPILRKRGYSEQVLIESVRHNLTSRIYGIPFIAEEKLLPITARTQS